MNEKLSPQLMCKKSIMPILCLQSLMYLSGVSGGDCGNG